jgi:ribose transport system substrate-binding protein
MKKTIIFILTIAMLGLPIFAQGNQEESTTQEKAKLSIGFSQCTLDSPFYVALMDAAKIEAEKQGVEFTYLDAQNNIQKQNNDIMDLISKGVDVLLINPVDPEGVTPSVESAKRAGIPIVAVDRSINGVIDSLIGRDNKIMGKVSGDLAVELLGGVGKAQGKILEIQGAAGCAVMMARRDGFHEAVDAEKGIEVIQSPYCDYVRSKAVKATQDIFQAHPDIDLIYAHNDDMALGGLQVFEQNGKDVHVVGVDGLMEAVKAIMDGRYDGTAMNDPAVLGTLAIQTAVKLAKGETVPTFIDGGTDLIDGSNAAEYYNVNDTFATK